ncbi:MAG TPA: hypothetical protein VK553_11635 [Candidatus Nitrosopolaris rasttigaisensis]|nr:hypothetical protein [Candidatus Nitrosopolaris rasttigaisensis]
MFSFNIFKKQQSKQNEKFIGNLGYLSIYNLEDIYSFVGESRIKAKIEELSSKATMGIRLENLVYGKEATGFYNKGPIDCMSMFLNYFKDVDIIQFLFDKLETFNEANYMKNSMWSIKRIETINGLIESFENRNKSFHSLANINQINELKAQLTYNYYFIDYHFFLISLYRILLTSKEIELKNSINSKILIDYFPKLDKIKKSLVDLNIWSINGLGNSILSALENYCANTNQTEVYSQSFEKAADEDWRF